MKLQANTLVKRDARRCRPQTRRVGMFIATLSALSPSSVRSDTHAAPLGLVAEWVTRAINMTLLTELTDGAVRRGSRSRLGFLVRGATKPRLDIATRSE